MQNILKNQNPGTPQYYFLLPSPKKNIISGLTDRSINNRGPKPSIAGSIRTNTQQAKRTIPPNTGKKDDIAGFVDTKRSFADFI